MTTPVAPTYLGYEDLKAFFLPGLKDAGLKPTILPGPTSPEDLKKSAGSILFINVGGGAGLTAEQLFERPAITLRAVGRQGFYADAEKLAMTADRLILGLSGSGMVGSAYTLYITRTGGRPTLLPRDNADRYAFSCSYIAESSTGL